MKKTIINKKTGDTYELDTDDFELAENEESTLESIERNNEEG